MSEKLCNEIGIPWFGEDVFKYWQLCASNENTTINEWLMNRLDRANGVTRCNEEIKITAKILNSNSMSFVKIPGVLFLWGYNINTDEKVCLTGGQTIDLDGHIRSFLRLSNKLLVKPLLDDNRWWEIANYYYNFEIIVMTEDLHDFQKREYLEALYAVRHQAIYWKPSGSQLNIYQDILENIEHIDEDIQQDHLSLGIKFVQRTHSVKDPWMVERHIQICSRYPEIVRYLNEYTWGNHLRNAVLAGFDETEDGVEKYFIFLREKIKLEKKLFQSELEFKRSQEMNFLKSIGVDIHENTSFYHWVIAAHRHGFNTGDAMLDVEAYVLYTNQKEFELQESEKQKKSELESYAANLGFLSYNSALNSARRNGFDDPDDITALKEYKNWLDKKKLEESSKREKLLNYHKKFLNSLGQEYISEYTWGRLLSIAKRNGFDYQVIGEEEALKKLFEKKENKKLEEKSLIDEHKRFLEKHNRGDLDWHNCLVAARKAGYRSENPYQDLLDYWNFQEAKERLRQLAIQQNIEEHKGILKKYGMEYRNEQTWSRLVNKAKIMFPYDENFVEKYLEYRSNI